MFNIRDIVNYKTLINPLDTRISCEFIEEQNIIQAYSMYYEEKGE